MITDWPAILNKTIVCVGANRRKKITAQRRNYIAAAAIPAGRMWCLVDDEMLWQEKLEYCIRRSAL